MSRVDRRSAALERESGAAATEFALVLPVLVLMVCALVGGGRVWFARSTIDQAAASAARAASLERTAVAATVAARRVVQQSVDARKLRCSSIQVDVDTAGFAAPVGAPASISVRVTCVLALGDLMLPGWPGTLTVESTAESVLDRYRGRR